jgi:hypothetical protein
VTEGASCGGERPLPRCSGEETHYCTFGGVAVGGLLKSTVGALWAAAEAWNSWAGFWPLYIVLAQNTLGKVRRVVLYFWAVEF